MDLPGRDRDTPALEVLFCRKDIIMFDRFKLAFLTLIAVGGAYFAPAALADSWNKDRRNVQSIVKCPDESYNPAATFQTAG
jgi:hypothetical protein